MTLPDEIEVKRFWMCGCPAKRTLGTRCEHCGYADPGAKSVASKRCCPRRADGIERKFRILHPTVWVDCECEHGNKWTDRYEFDFSLPLGGAYWPTKENPDD